MPDDAPAIPPVVLETAADIRAYLASIPPEDAATLVQAINVIRSLIEGAVEGVEKTEIDQVTGKIPLVGGLVDRAAVSAVTMATTTVINGVFASVLPPVTGT